MNGDKSAILVGATGLVGSQLLRLLAGDSSYARVLVLARRQRPAAGGAETSKMEWRVLDFDKAETWNEAGRADDVFCCLGTTIKQAGSQDAFRRVDHDYPLALGRAAKALGSRQFLIVTSLGASARSPIFYNRVKAELEENLVALALPRLVIVRPSVLAGERQEPRSGERAALAVLGAAGALMVGPLKKYRAIEAASVAAAMLLLARRGGPALEIVPSDRLQALAAEVK